MHTDNPVQASIELAQAGFTSTIVSQSGSLFNNGHIAVSKDMIFGLSVWDGETWFPLSQATAEEVAMVRGEIAKGGHFLWHDDLNKVAAEVEVA